MGTGAKTAFAAIVVVLGLVVAFIVGTNQGRDAERQALAALPSSTPVVITHQVVRVVTKTVPVYKTRTILKTVKVPVYRTVVTVRKVYLAAPTATPARPTRTPEPTETPIAPPTDTSVANSTYTTDASGKPIVIDPEDGVAAYATNYRWDHGDQFSSLPAGHVYAVLHVTLKNRGKSTATYNSLDFQLVGSVDHIRYSTTFMGGADTRLSSGQLFPDDVVAGDVSFEIPTTKQSYSILWRPNLFGTSLYVPYRAK